jgi:hypothetical protein
METKQKLLTRVNEIISEHLGVRQDEITKESLTEYRGQWKDMYPSTQTRQKVQERARAFLKFCNECGWLSAVPKLSAIRVDEPPTMPLDDAEYALLLKTALAVFPEPKSTKIHALLQLMRYSGLAIRDAVTLQRDEIIKGKHYRIVTTRQKTEADVSVVIPDAVAQEVLSVLNGNPKYVFWNTGTGTEQSLVTNWQHDLRFVECLATGPFGFLQPGVLLDGGMVEGRGGTGTLADWSAARVARERGFRVLLAGGLGPDNVMQAVREVMPAAIDLNSGVEVAPGRKDRALIERALNALSSFEPPEISTWPW